MEDALEQQLGIAKVAPKVGRDLLEAARADKLRYGRAVKERLVKAKESLKDTAVSNVISAVGGALAEPFRRSGVGRIAKGVRGQAAAMGLTGIGISAATNALGFMSGKSFGLAYTTMAGWLLSVSMYDSDDKRDPVAVALEATTYKAKNPKKSDKKD